MLRADVRHRRRQPIDYAFAHRTTMWLVDAETPDAPFPGWARRWLGIRSADHLGPGDRPLADKLRTWLSENDVGWSATRVAMLTGARTAGYVFDPLTTYFCFDAAGRLEGVLAEVHNTYGGRHCYPLPATADEDGTTLRAGVDKEFYVSPFFAVEGRYDVRARLDADLVAVAITLTRDGRRLFAGSVRARPVPATRRVVVRALLRDPLAAQRVALLIRWHGVRLWLRRLPVVPRLPRTVKEPS